ncbi:hypothetical protein N0V83_003060 [Neocucurbitaria cava]|uniref:Ankyrin repeat protein n=1 Tax=Neocucurbitaria cava TaxID=798079 RepID=A0A9W8YD93_9PLEO|nr:hypothetical protein N0V83_003060 [Neocucurbitaria cava]
MSCPLIVSEFKRLLCVKVSSDCIDLSPLHERVIGLTPKPALEYLEWPVYCKYINARDKGGRTPLSWAAEQNDEHTIRYLLQHGADLEIPCQNHWTPLRYAAMAPTTNAMRILIELGASAAPESPCQTNALHDVAYHKRDLEYAKLLEDTGCLIDHRDTGGATPLTKACYADNDIVAEYLLRRGANPHNIDNSGMSCVAKAIHSGANGVLKLLLSFKAEYSHINNQGCSILHTAAESEAVTEETLEILVSAPLHGVDIGLRNKSGRTAAQVFGLRTDVNGAFRAKFRQLLDSIVPPEPRTAGPSHPDAWPVTVM